MRALAVAIAVVTTLVLVGCGGSTSNVAVMAPQPLLRVYVSPWRVQADGERVSLVQLENRLQALKGRSGFITLDDESEARAPLPLTDAQTARMQARSRKVLALAERYGLRVGWAPASDQGG